MVEVDDSRGVQPADVRSQAVPRRNDVFGPVYPPFEVQALVVRAPHDQGRVIEVVVDVRRPQRQMLRIVRGLARLLELTLDKMAQLICYAVPIMRLEVVDVCAVQTLEVDVRRAHARVERDHGSGVVKDGPRARDQVPLDEKLLAVEDELVPPRGELAEPEPLVRYVAHATLAGHGGAQVVQMGSVVLAEPPQHRILPWRGGLYLRALARRYVHLNGRQYQHGPAVVHDGGAHRDRTIGLAVVAHACPHRQRHLADARHGVSILHVDGRHCC